MLNSDCGYFSSGIYKDPFVPQETKRILNIIIEPKVNIFINFSLQSFYH